MSFFLLGSLNRAYTIFVIVTSAFPTSFYFLEILIIFSFQVTLSGVFKRFWYKKKTLQTSGLPLWQDVSGVEAVCLSVCLIENLNLKPLILLFAFVILFKANHLAYIGGQIQQVCVKSQSNYFFM